MTDFKMKATTPLNGYAKQFNGVSLAEVTNRHILSIATPAGGEQQLAIAIKKALGAEVPKAGKTTQTLIANGRFLGMQPGQMFFVFQPEEPEFINTIREKLKNVSYLTDQSDGFVMVIIAGEKARIALERICAIDLQLDVFPTGSFARTAMEHLGVTIVCEASDTFLLISPRSTAEALLHALETSIHNIS